MVKIWVLNIIQVLIADFFSKHPYAFRFQSFLRLIIFFIIIIPFSATRTKIISQIFSILEQHKFHWFFVSCLCGCLCAFKNAKSSLIFLVPNWCVSLRVSQLLTVMFFNEFHISKPRKVFVKKFTFFSKFFSDAKMLPLHSSVTFRLF
uniref:Uncharacterized protein n=1 Tax=Kalanchoe fedtschenkoi TaxID=63787 RepID=A0A7N0VLL4_KALFE